jgi:hypothetical protein
MDLKKTALAPRETRGGFGQHPRQKMLDTPVDGFIRQLGLLFPQRADERIQVFQRLAGNPPVLLNAPEVVSDAFRVRRGGCWHRGFLLNAGVLATDCSQSAPTPTGLLLESRVASSGRSLAGSSPTHSPLPEGGNDAQDGRLSARTGGPTKAGCHAA